MKILIADDSKLSRAKLVSALLKLGHDTLEAQSGEEAIELFKTGHPDLVILDVVMGGMSGFECATKIRKINQKDWIPIIFLSSTIDDEYISRGINAGGDDYLTKPFSEIVLSAKIKAMQRIADMRNELIEITKRLDHLSCTDTLTGLANRMHFDKHLKETMSTANRYQQPFALLFIDIDHFKEINDKLGHHAGDSLLKEVSNRLRSCLRKSDFIARLGGDEFAIILPQFNDRESVESLAKKIKNMNQNPFVIDNQSLNITFSIGVACYPEAGMDCNSFLINADVAMYDVKRRGRNNYEIFKPRKSS